MKLSSEKLQLRLLWCMALSPIFIVLGLIFWLRPWYGTTDDGAILIQCDIIRDAGFSSAFKDFIQADFSWGMIRPIYFFMMRALFCSTAPNPTALYVWNAIFVFSVLFFCGVMLQRLLPKPFSEKKWFLPAFVVLSLSVYRWHDQFYIASLQEKLVLTAGALSLLILDFRTSSRIPKKILDLFCIIALVIIGFCTKAQYMIFLPALTLYLFARVLREQKKFWPSLNLFVFLSVAFGAMVFTKIVASRGGYTSRYSLANVPENLLTRQTFFILALAIFSLVFEIYQANKRNLGWDGLLKALAPSSFLFAFIAIMSPWTINDSYILSPIAPFCALCILSIANYFPKEKFVKLILFVGVFAIVMTSFRAYRSIGRLSDLREIIFSDTIRERSRDALTVVVPCLEGRNLIQTYFDRFISVHPEMVNTLAEAKGKNILVITDSAVCIFTDGTKLSQLKLLSKPLFPGSFGLYEPITPL